MIPSRLKRAAIAVCALAWMQAAGAVSAPDWMRAQVTAPIPAHDDETDAVLLYSEASLTVLAPGKMKRVERYAYRILRRDGESYGTVRADYSPMDRITAMRAWSIPAEGKDYEVKQKDIVETGITDVEGGELVSDVRRKILRIPAATPGSIVGYEIEQDLQPYAMTDEWTFQRSVPVRETRFSVTLPAGWTYKVFWINYPETAPVQATAGLSRWTLNDLKPVKLERSMPPWRGIAGRMVISLQPPEGKQGGFQSWKDMGVWYLGLTNGRRDASAEIRQKVQEITQSSPTQLAKMQALASFIQKEIRYVAIELGVGGVQPHPAAEVFSHRYGDCKDKVTLLSSMLKEIGVESHYVIINTERGSVVPTTPPNMGFNHVIVAIQLPAGVDTSTLPAVIDHKTLGKVLFFDPTSQLIPFGYLPGGLQANTAMFVTPAGGELVTLPQTASALNGLQRTAKLTLDENGGLRGEVRETYLGDAAAGERWNLRAAQQDVDQIKPVESMLTHSLSTFAIEKATVGNLRVIAQPLVWNYTLVVDRYAKNAGDLVLIRPRVFGSLSSSMMETKEARQHPVEFDAPLRNTDVFEITLPAGYAVDELPPPVNEDIGFVSYRSATELKGNLLRYTRTLEVKELSLPVAKADALKHFFRTIENDERMSAVLKRAQ
jgi:transglutaminase-like putative cysteine protease